MPLVKWPTSRGWHAGEAPPAGQPRASWPARSVRGSVCAPVPGGQHQGSQSEVACDWQPGTVPAASTGALVGSGGGGGGAQGLC